jgi:hypothetical protein
MQLGESADFLRPFIWNFRFRNEFDKRKASNCVQVTEKIVAVTLAMIKQEREGSMSRTHKVQTHRD